MKMPVSQLTTVHEECLSEHEDQLLGADDHNSPGALKPQVIITKTSFHLCPPHLVDCCPSHLLT